ncbi:MAG TPA: 16S rRNA (guanine(527)-N(7))-methyltransferase RsmG [Terriglobales bacterium]|nr:16S rRNA (guanine(527)-N(7))-methyltransferase RsmG [Terriglobales bacterium]
MEPRAILAPFLPASGLTALQLEQVHAYLDLLLKWNEKTNLTSVRQPEEILRRHFGESFFLAAALAEVNSPKAGQHASAVRFIDLGSGAGFPGIPLKIYAPHLSGTLIESQNKKATFLKEVIRRLHLPEMTVFGGRAEEFAQSATNQAGSVTLRAVERFETALPVAASLVAPGGHLALLIGSSRLEAVHKLLPSFSWQPPQPLPLSDARVLLVGKLGQQAHQ